MTTLKMKGLVIASLLHISYAQECESDTCQALAPPPCSLYMAVSTIPGAGLGVFTGVDRVKGDQLGHGDVLIPIVDIWYHLQNSPEYRQNEDFSSTLEITADYVWQGAEMGMAAESSDADTYCTAFAPGLDAAINCNLAVINVDKDYPKYDDGGLHRSKDPGAGAFSPYQNCTTIVTEPVPAGGELFKYYGDTWFTTRESVFGAIPLYYDFPRAQDLLRRFDETIVQRENVPSAASSDMYDLMTSFPLRSRVINAIPRNYSKMETVRAGGLRAVYEEATVRTIDDLDANGRCLDRVRPGMSTIPQAGRGLFTKYFHSKGSIVGGTPLLFTHSQDFFRRYEGNWFDLKSRPSSNLYSYQLLMNYCFHHESASLYLCPYGYEINYINHNKTLANVKLRWAEDGVMNQKASLLTESPKMMEHKASSPGLFWDYVATRDIMPGEEIFLDYGDAWEQAWLKHVGEFGKIIHHSPDYISGRDWNNGYADAILLTKEEQEQTPYPANLETRCLEEISRPFMVTPTKANRLWTFETYGIPCNIVDRKTGPDDIILYRVAYEVPIRDDDYERPQGTAPVWTLSDWILRESIRMFDIPYTTDMFMEGVFRHPIGLPDELMPDAWRGYQYQL